MSPCIGEGELCWFSSFYTLNPNPETFAYYVDNKLIVNLIYSPQLYR